MDAVPARQSRQRDQDEVRNGDSDRDLLRFITCGSVDDGKSTLIGRLLHDSKLIFEDQLAALARDSERHGTTGDDIDLALLVDGLQAEREQGITIDIAYRFFSTPNRSFMVADTPGHEQYTRNMATGASLAVNKIDLAGYAKETFDRIVGDYAAFAAKLGFVSIVPIPISARFGDNVTKPSPNTSWYRGPALLDYLEDVEADQGEEAKRFRFPVQWVNRPSHDFRGYSGTVACGQISCGDPVIVVPSGQATRVDRIVTGDGPLAHASSGDAVTITLTEEVDIARGDVLVAPTARPEVADQFAAHVIWMDEEALIPGRSYLVRAGTKVVPASVTAIKYKIDVNTQEHLAAPTLGLNDIGFCNISTASPIVFDPYDQNRKTGAFIVIDRYSNRTVGAGMIAFGLRRATNIHWQPVLVRKSERAALKKQKPAIIWFTGLSGAGKSTIANIVEQQLYAAGCHTTLLDGDNVRHGLCRDLGFTEADRVENIRRVGEVAKLMVEGGLIVLCSFISPYRAERDMVRALVGEGEFIEVFVDTPIGDCIERDPKGLYAKAKAGTLKNFTGIDAPYEVPDAPEVHLVTHQKGPEPLADEVIAALRSRGIGA
jgi:bifunctional enzyme CysN/CysC